LRDVVGALLPRRRLAYLWTRRHQERDQNRDDGDHEEQLDQGKAIALFHGSNSLITPLSEWKALPENTLRIHRPAGTAHATFLSRRRHTLATRHHDCKRAETVIMPAALDWIVAWLIKPRLC